MHLVKLGNWIQTVYLRFFVKVQVNKILKSKQEPVMKIEKAEVAKMSKEDFIKIEEVATNLIGITKVLIGNPVDSAISLCIATSVLAASVGINREEMLELITSYYDKTDKMLTAMETAIKNGEDPTSITTEAPVKTRTDLN